MYREEIYRLSPNEWEWFAQDALFHLGFMVHVGPSEGADDGLDMIVEHGNVKYLVSCKHNHLSRKNVGVRDEQDIRDRVEQHECNGFIAFYSVGATTALKKKFISLSNAGIGDVPPDLSSAPVSSPIPHEKEIGREEALFRRTDHRLPA